jgi:hypothetical protein
MPDIYQNVIFYSAIKLSELYSGTVKVANITTIEHESTAAG